MSCRPYPPPLRREILSQSRLISALSLVADVIYRGPYTRSSVRNCEPKRRYIFLNRKVSSKHAREHSVCATFRRIYRGPEPFLITNTSNTRKLAAETSAADRFTTSERARERETIGSAPTLRVGLQNIDLFSLDFVPCFMERPSRAIRARATAAPVIFNNRRAQKRRNARDSNGYLSPSEAVCRFSN